MFYIYIYIYIGWCKFLASYQTIIKILRLGLVMYRFNPTAQSGCDTWSIFKRSLINLNLEFSFFKVSWNSKIREPIVSFYLPKAGGRVVGFLLFQRVLALYVIQTASSRVWALVNVCVSCSYRHCTETVLICFCGITVNSRYFFSFFLQSTKAQKSGKNAAML